MKLSTLCYIEQDGRYLMLHRTVKKNDVNIHEVQVLFVNLFSYLHMHCLQFLKYP